MKNVIKLTALAAMIYIAVTMVLPEDFSGTTIHLAGDSTMSIKLASKRPDTGWGEPFASMLCQGVRVINHAKNGRSTKSFLSEGLWKNLLAQVRVGDVVMIQFGHNDQKSANPILYASPWDVYRDNLQSFVVDVKALGAEPVLLTSIVRRAFNLQGKPVQTLGDYPAVTRAVATEMGVNLIDHNALTHELISSMGPIDSSQLYLHLAPGISENYAKGKQDDTHLSSQGASKVAALAAVEFEKIRPDLVCL